MEMSDLVNAVIGGDKEGAQKAFSDMMAAKVTDALDVKKVEVASNLLGTQEVETNEPEAVETEVDGSSNEEPASTEESPE